MHGTYQASLVCHLKCLEAQSCGFCGIRGLTSLCRTERCLQVIHPWCKERYSEYCVMHQGKARRKDVDKVGAVRQAIWKAIDEEEALRSMKESYTDQQPSYIPGPIFWYAVADYFPAEAKLEHWPDFTSALMTSPDILHYPSKPLEEDYVDSMIASLEPILGLTSSKVDEIRIEIPSQEHKRMRQDESAILTELKMLDLRPYLEEYLAYFERSLVTKELPAQDGKSSKGGKRKIGKLDDECVCEVCGDGDYDEDDLIVICSVMSM